MVTWRTATRAAEGTIRKRHGSDFAETAETELHYFFSAVDLNLR